MKDLYLFGSAASGNLSEDSDLDFIVQFDRQGYEGAFDQFLDFKPRLEQIYGVRWTYTTKRNSEIQFFRKKWKAPKG